MRLLRGALLVAILSVSACGGGGGGGGSSSSTPPPSTPATVTVEGVAQKGPMMAGASISVSSVSPRGVIGAPIATTTTNDDLGRYVFDVESGQIIAITATGGFHDELHGTPESAAVQLRAVLEVSTDVRQTANVNVLTHLAAPRILALLAGGATLADAERTALAELVDELGGVIEAPDLSPLHTMSLYSPARFDPRSAYLLTLSAWIAEHGRQLADDRSSGIATELQAVLDGMADDFRDGSMDDVPAMDAIIAAGRRVDVEGVMANLAALASREGSARYPGDMMLFVDSDSDGRANLFDSDDDGDGVADDADSYPLDWACHLESQGDGESCAAEAEIPANYVADAVTMDRDGTVLLLSAAQNRIYRWSTDRERHGYPLDIPEGATSIASSATHARTYVGLDSGDIVKIEAEGGFPLSDFANIDAPVHSLVDAGDHLIAVDTNGNVYVFTYAGVLADQRYTLGSNHVYSAEAGRLLLLTSWNPTDIESLRIDPVSGEFLSGDSSPYHGDFGMSAPLNVSADGRYVMTGHGDIFDIVSLEWVRSLPGQFADVAMLDDGSIATIKADSTATRLDYRDARGGVLEYDVFDGAPVSVFSRGTRVHVVTQGLRPEVRAFEPGGDADDDGVANTLDAFPQDPAASVDSDRDGYPDAWNDGRSAEDSTAGLTLDAYPADSACFLPGHGSDGVCNPAARLPSSIPEWNVADARGMVYSLHAGLNAVYRWDPVLGHRNPLPIGEGDGDTAQLLRYSPEQDRLYLSYDSGKISYIDLSGAGAETYLTAARNAVLGMQPAGNYLWIAGSGVLTSGRWSASVDTSGEVVSEGDFRSEYSRHSAWNPVLERVYFFRDGISPNDLQYQSVDQATGEIGVAIDSPYHGDFSVRPPIRISADGSRVLLGGGNVFDAETLTILGSVPSPISDARWTTDGEIVLLREFGDAASIERLDSTGRIVEARAFDGAPVALLPAANGYTVLTDQDRLSYASYLPSDDSDADGVSNTSDAFPLDPAASIDTDNDGFPDAWNDGSSGADSTTGLVLDAYPDDAACYLPEHGDGTTCDVGSTIPDYAPASVVTDDAGLVYLFSPDDNRVFRWDSVSGEHLNPLVVGSDAWLNVEAPTVMAVHVGHGRLYFGYDTGAITYVDLAAPGPEQPFATMLAEVSSLAEVGDFLLARDEAGYSASNHSIYDRDGHLRDVGGRVGYSPDYAWNPALERVYFDPYDLSYEQIDQATGTIVSYRQSFAHGGHNIAPIVRVSADGSLVLAGNGKIHDADTLEVLGRVSTGFTDAVWLDDGGLVTVRDDAGGSVLVRLSAAGVPVEVVNVDGVPLALRRAGDAYVMVTSAGRPEFTIYAPTDDSDGDGVDNTADAFPQDAAASVDTDGDGYPDTWNPGKSQADSTTGLTLDAYPGDSACYLPEHGDGVNCDITSTMPDYLPASIETDANGIVYLFSPDNYRVYRWDSGTGEHLNPLVVGSDAWLGGDVPTLMTHHAGHDRLYFGYDSGDITYVDLGAPGTEQYLASLGWPVRGLADVGNFLLAQDDEGAWESHHIFDAGGVLRDSVEWNHYSRVYAWNPSLARVYYFSDGTSPNDLHYETVNQVSGVISDLGESPYHGDYRIQPPILVSVDGNQVMLGSGDIYDALTLEVIAAIPGEFDDAVWLSDGGIATVRGSGGRSQLERRNASRQIVELVEFDGQPLALRQAGSALVLITDAGRPAFTIYTPSDDSDGDGVENTVDAFPQDPAASVDSDRDGYPDSWNAGSSQGDSTTGLELDAYPNDSACYLPEHGDGTTCDVTSTLTPYRPDSVEIDDSGVVYLFNGSYGRVNRWDAASGEHLNPFILGAGPLSPGGEAPWLMEHHAGHDRLYFGYSNGEITYIDLGSPDGEQYFSTLARPVQGLAHVGNFLLAQDDTGAWESHYIYDQDGNLTDSKDLNHYSREYAWNSTLDRVYFFRDGLSPNDLMYEDINQVTGEIDGSGETPYHGDYAIWPPIRVSFDGSRVLLGSGDVYDASSLVWLDALPEMINDAVWLPDGRLVTAQAGLADARIQTFSVSLEAGEIVMLPNPLIGALRFGSSVIVVTEGETPVFTQIEP